MSSSTHAETERVVLGDQHYEVHRFWGRAPKDVAVGVFSTIAVDSDGTVYVCQRGNVAPVIAFAADGNFRAAWERGGVIDPHGINIDANDRVLLVDRDAHEVQIRTLDGQGLTTLGQRNMPSFQAPFNHPTSASVAGDGEIYVADGYGNSMVHRFGADGRHLSSFGAAGSGDGEFSTPHSIWIDGLDRVLVADRENNRICVYDRDGKLMTHWYGFYHPMDIAEDTAGAIYVTDQTPRLTRLNSDGEITGRCRPVWNVPHGLACSPNGAIHFAEMNPNSIVTMKSV